MNDLRIAVRTLRATPVLTLVVILSLALGIGANTAMFSIVNSLLLRTLPVERADRLVLLLKNAPVASSAPWSNPVWKQIRDHHADVFQETFACSRRMTRFNLAQGGETDFVIGRTQTFDRVPFTIVGVMPWDFFGTDVGSRADVILPMGTEPLMRGRDSQLDRPTTSWLLVMARLKDDQTVESAEQALRGVQPQIRDATMPATARADARAGHLAAPFGLQPAAGGTSAMRARYRQPILAIMTVVALVLLILANIDATQLPGDVLTLEQVLAESIAPRRWNLFLLGTFALAALVLALIGIYGLMNHLVTQRLHEIGVRIALGAQRAEVVSMVVRQGMTVALAGIVAGVLGALALTRLMSSLLYEVAPTDPQTFVAVTVALATTALVACCVPALKAALVDPATTLRHE